MTSSDSAFSITPMSKRPLLFLKIPKTGFFLKNGDFWSLPEVGHGRDPVEVIPRSFRHVLQPKFMAILYVSFPTIAAIWETLLKEKVGLLSSLAPPGGLESKIWPQNRVFLGRLPLVRSFYYEKSNIGFFVPSAFHQETMLHMPAGIAPPIWSVPKIAGF